MKRFEYITFSFPAEPPFPAVLPHEELQQVLNEWGQKGWEVASALPTASTLGRTQQLVIVMKRETDDE